MVLESAVAWGEGWQQLGGVAVETYGLLAVMAAEPAPNVLHELSSVTHKIGLRAVSRSDGRRSKRALGAVHIPAE